ncbi:hypothetical protein B0T25DRAFT_559761 [Lasiosphaeria hispida]|uniref:Uncharacterized protein n=1 Tax=Lasiosphaeria hispida TaxID=260671 RepID=A0AAJ0H7B7_9PEZI|nr:hypothetical protein B0T25DRAFT_559761 [Lasiosphaeria hispida]
MPPRARAAGTSESDTSALTLRLKHGIHTVFLFVTPGQTFADITTELLELLRERYPDGLTTSVAPPKTTPIPSSGEATVVYGVPKVPADLAQGWKSLRAGEKDTVASKRLKDMGPVAFAFAGEEEEEEGDVVFEVELPALEEEF